MSFAELRVERLCLMCQQAATSRCGLHKPDTTCALQAVPGGYECTAPHATPRARLARAEPGPAVQHAALQCAVWRGGQQPRKGGVRSAGGWNTGACPAWGLDLSARHSFVSVWSGSSSNVRCPVRVLGCCVDLPSLCRWGGGLPAVAGLSFGSLPAGRTGSLSRCLVLCPPLGGLKVSHSGRNIWTLGQI